MVGKRSVTGTRSLDKEVFPKQGYLMRKPSTVSYCPGMGRIEEDNRAEGNRGEDNRQRDETNGTDERGGMDGRTFGAG
jgi:hypothetical protein